MFTYLICIYIKTEETSVEMKIFFAVPIVVMEVKGINCIAMQQVTWFLTA